MNHLSVQLSTATGCVFSGNASSLDLRTEEGSIHINSNEENFVSMVHTTEVTVQTPDGPRVFALDNAVAGLKGHRFTVLAESVRLIEPGIAGEFADSSSPETSRKPDL